MHFLDRADAGRLLARRLIHLAGRRDVIVLALPLAGVPVASEISPSLCRSPRNQVADKCRPKPTKWSAHLFRNHFLASGSFMMISVRRAMKKCARYWPALPVKRE